MRAQIPDAKALAMKYRSRAVLVIEISDGTYSAASYGQTRKLCDEAGRFLDALCDQIDTGMVELPESLRTGAC